MNKKVSILFITMGINEGASRFRVKQYLPYFRRDGYRTMNYPLHWGAKPLPSYSFFPRIFFYCLIVFNKIFTIALAPFFGVIFFQRSVINFFSPSIERIIKKINKNIIFDYDDSIWLNYRKRNNPVNEVIRLSKQVIAGNRYLYNYSIKINKETSLISTPVETSLFRPLLSRRENKSLVNIGWAGSSPNLKYLYLLKQVFRELSLKYGNKIKLTIFCDQDARVNLNIKKNFIEWTADKELKVMQDFDIGIMPLEDNEWTRGKCAFKAIQYMSLGIPCVISPVGANKDVAGDDSVYFANDNGEWVYFLDKLISSSHLRKIKSCRMRKIVLDKYSTEVNYCKVAALINLTLNS